MRKAELKRQQAEAELHARRRETDNRKRYEWLAKDGMVSHEMKRRLGIMPPPTHHMPNPRLSRTGRWTPLNPRNKTHA